MADFLELEFEELKNAGPEIHRSDSEISCSASVLYKCK